MYEAFFNYLEKFSSEPVSEDDKVLLKKAFVPSKLRKRQYFLQAGDQCKNFAFIVKGAMRQYSVDDKGTEYIVRLGVEEWWMGDRESWVMLSPSIYNIDAWEDTEMLLINRANVLELIKTIHPFCEMIQQLDEKNNIANQRRLTSTISSTAQKRYTEFVDCYPELVQRFPQHIIASYLGITKDTLSRVRRQLLQNKAI
ncbi:Crp/Fnr family transcriptional regulator [Dyadobacter psychrophilus]|uniref:cAMP-binding domain of CRP or a regulatory subunit of cAMP-dependent protein kinases n=1 Tax=Dyadobacter psychrophilus TaxID=651661 RepID=A0A1T5G510_9BACT|nr:Crp/Fnr family transcriptional regulator [Dyadobacter psychrophilus]SKC03414.1 cAMP-binding domain of CRP or a regulatory subunit of cAMP-dependent protein kinases [Dyadobacter psychrophilus]